MRTFPIQSAFNKVPGQPWGPRSTATGNPNTGVAEYATITCLGTPQAVTTEVYHATVVVDGGSAGIGDVYEVSTLSVGSPWAFTCLGGEDATAVAAGIAAAGAGDTIWTITSTLGVVVLTSQAPGVQIDVPTATFIPAAGTGSITMAEYAVGAAANTYAVTDNLSSVYSYTVQPGDGLTDVATGLAAQITGDYPAAAIGAVIYITGTVGVPFTMTDSSVNNQTPGGSAVFNIVSGATADLLPGGPGVLRLTTTSKVALWNQLVSGTSYDVKVWVWDVNTKLWLAIQTIHVTADAVTFVDAGAISFAFLELLNFVGGAVALNTVVGNSTLPGQN